MNKAAPFSENLSTSDAIGLAANDPERRQMASEYLDFGQGADRRNAAYVIVRRDHPLYPLHRGGQAAAGTVRHQYGCLRCQQFAVEGLAERVADPETARRLASELGCEGDQRPEAVAAIFGVPVKKVWGEALAELEDGRFLAVLNCD